MKKFLILLLTLTITVFSYSQTQINKQHLTDDYNTFIRYLEETHPDPYSAYGGRVEFMRNVQHTRAQIVDITTKEQLADLLTRFITKLSDGHTFISKSLNSTAGASNKILPIQLGIAVDGLFIANSTEEWEIYKGCKITAINGISVDSLAIKATSILPVENKYGSYRKLSALLSMERNVHKLINTTKLQLNVIYPNKKEETINVEYVENPQFSKKRSILDLKKDNGLINEQLIKTNKQTAGYFEWNAIASKELIPIASKNPNILNFILNLTYQNRQRPNNDSLAIQGVPELFSTFSDLLHSMKNLHSNYLIIDLRRNTGGWSSLCLPLLYMLYGDRYLNYESKAEYDRLLSPLLLKKWGVESIEQYNESNNTNYRLGDFIFGTFFDAKKQDSLEEKRNNLSLIGFNSEGVEYTGNLNGKPVYEPYIIVLTSPMTFSAAYHFIYFLTEIGNATLVGVPSEQAGNTFMETTDFELPNTKIRGSISNGVQLFYPNDPVKGKVLMPDFPMKWEDYAKYNFDENAEILYALDLINGGKMENN